MKYNVVGWGFTFLVAFGIQWAAYCYRRHASWPTGLTPGFITTFGIYSALMTILGAAMLAFLFFIASKQSGLVPPRPTPLLMVLIWVIMEEVARLSAPQGPKLGEWRLDEFLINLDFLMIIVCLSGIMMAYNAGLLGREIGLRRT